MFFFISYVDFYLVLFHSFIYREADELKQKILKFKSGTSMLQDRTLWVTQQQLQKVLFIQININILYSCLLILYYFNYVIVNLISYILCQTVITAVNKNVY